MPLGRHPLLGLRAGRASTAALIALASVSLALASCGPAAAGSNLSPHATASLRLPGPTLSGHVRVTGAYSVSGAFTARPEIVLGGSATPAPAGYSCADYAAGRLGSNGEFALPEVETHGDPSVYVHLTVTAGYTGAGTYDSSTGHNVTGGAVVTEGNTSNGGFLDAFRAASDTTISVTVHPDGSGVVNALNWYSSDSDSELSGVITWTCSP